MRESDISKSASSDDMLATSSLYPFSGNNTDGKYFVTANRMAFHCELRPIHVKIFIDKMQNGVVIPVKGVRIADIACGTSHSVEYFYVNTIMQCFFFPETLCPITVAHIGGSGH